jgi:16S rRNA (guanine(966)-N(2))-methyltransferase RsmD
MAAATRMIRYLGKMSLRIVGGSLGGRLLRAPRGLETRPSADRVREAIFQILGPPPASAQVLDLFAGAGTLGLEAVSRGAAHAVFVDQSRAAVRCLGANAKTLGVFSLIEIHQKGIWRALSQLERAQRRFDWIFVDPPYRVGLAERALEQLGAGELCNVSGLVLAEADRRELFADSFGCLTRVDQRRYGDTQVLFYRRDR